MLGETNQEWKERISEEGVYHLICVRMIVEELGVLDGTLCTSEVASMSLLSNQSGEEFDDLSVEITRLNKLIAQRNQDGMSVISFDSTPQQGPRTREEILADKGKQEKVLYSVKRFGDFRTPKYKEARRRWRLDVEDLEKLPNQSGPEKIMKFSPRRVETNVEFGDNESEFGFDLSGEMDMTRGVNDTNDVDLSSFLSRPVRIYSTSEITPTPGWQYGGSIDAVIDPWTLFVNNKRVINRVNNFNLVRGNLHVKVTVNGNSFSYGRAICYYLPYATMDDFSTTAVGSLTTLDIVQGSQMPHVYIDPTTSTAGEMVLPFFYHYNNADLPAGDYGDLGRLVITTMNVLRHANDAATSRAIDINIFAWMENAVVSVPTSNNAIGLVSQSGEEVDKANAKGVVSGPASALSKVAMTLSSIPMIRPYAMATSMVAGTLSEVARLFGYSRPPITKAPEPYNPRIVSSLANGTVPDALQKLTLDDKQELTIDPRIAGMDATDPLAIKNIACRESFWFTTNWPVATATGEMLCEIAVNPVTWREVGGSPSTGYQFTAVGFAALPFQFWSGSMKYRFQVVCSKFHRGRIAVVYDPNYVQKSGGKFEEYNVNYMQIVDISEVRDFEIQVQNGQAFSLLESAAPGSSEDSIDTFKTNANPAFTNKQSFGNGILGLYVLNELVSPDYTVTNDIEINVFVSAGDDFEVYVPNDIFSSFVFKSQSGEEPTITASSPSLQQGESMINGLESDEPPEVTSIYVGEKVKSFRTLLKRYALWRSFAVYGSTNRIFHVDLCPYPYMRGNALGAATVNERSTESGLPFYTFSNTLLLHWVTKAFSGWRGSLRYKILNGSDFVTLRHRVALRDLAGDYSQTVRDPANAGYPLNTNAKISSESLPGFVPPSSLTTGTFVRGEYGSAYAASSVNSAMEFEIPFFSQYRFEPGKRGNYAEDIGLYQFPIEISSEARNTAGNDVTGMHYMVATGEDFQTYFFTGLPRVYYEGTPPVAN